MKIGDCFMMPVPPKYLVPHLWIVISAPDADGSIVIVNITHDWERAGKECILSGGCHRRIPDDSYVNFPDALLIPPANITALIPTLVTLEKPLNAELIGEIVAIAKTSKSIPVALKALI